MVVAVWRGEVLYSFSASVWKQGGAQQVEFGVAWEDKKNNLWYKMIWTLSVHDDVAQRTQEIQSSGGGTDIKVHDSSSTRWKRYEPDSTRVRTSATFRGLGIRRATRSMRSQKHSRTLALSFGKSVCSIWEPGGESQIKHQRSGIAFVFIVCEAREGRRHFINKKNQQLSQHFLPSKGLEKILAMKWTQHAALQNVFCGRITFITHAFCCIKARGGNTEGLHWMKHKMNHWRHSVQLISPGTSLTISIEWHTRIQDDSVPASGRSWRRGRGQKVRGRWFRLVAFNGEGITQAGILCVEHKKMPLFWRTPLSGCQSTLAKRERKTLVYGENTDTRELLGLGKLIEMQQIGVILGLRIFSCCNAIVGLRGFQTRPSVFRKIEASCLVPS